MPPRKRRALNVNPPDPPTPAIFLAVLHDRLDDTEQLLGDVSQNYIRPILDRLRSIAGTDHAQVARIAFTRPALTSSGNKLSYTDEFAPADEALKTMQLNREGVTTSEPLALVDSIFTAIRMFVHLLERRAPTDRQPIFHITIITSSAPPGTSNHQDSQSLPQWQMAPHEIIQRNIGVSIVLLKPPNRHMQSFFEQVHQDQVVLPWFPVTQGEEVYLSVLSDNGVATQPDAPQPQGGRKRRKGDDDDDDYTESPERRPRKAPRKIAAKPTDKALPPTATTPASLLPPRTADHLIQPPSITPEVQSSGANTPSVPIPYLQPPSTFGTSQSVSQSQMPAPGEETFNQAPPGIGFPPIGGGGENWEPSLQQDIGAYLVDLPDDALIGTSNPNPDFYPDAESSFVDLPLDPSVYWDDAFLADWPARDPTRLRQQFQVLNFRSQAGLPLPPTSGQVTQQEHDSSASSSQNFIPWPQPDTRPHPSSSPETQVQGHPRGWGSAEPVNSSIAPPQTNTRSRLPSDHFIQSFPFPASAYVEYEPYSASTDTPTPTQETYAASQQFNMHPQNVQHTPLASTSGGQQQQQQPDFSSFVPSNYEAGFRDEPNSRPPDAGVQTPDAASQSYSRMSVDLSQSSPWSSTPLRLVEYLPSGSFDTTPSQAPTPNPYPQAQAQSSSSSQALFPSPRRGMQQQVLYASPLSMSQTLHTSPLSHTSHNTHTPVSTTSHDSPSAPSTSDAPSASGTVPLSGAAGAAEKDKGKEREWDPSSNQPIFNSGALVGGNPSKVSTIVAITVVDLFFDGTQPKRLRVPITVIMSPDQNVHEELWPKLGFTITPDSLSGPVIWQDFFAYLTRNHIPTCSLRANTRTAGGIRAFEVEHLASFDRTCRLLIERTCFARVPFEVRGGPPNTGVILFPSIKQQTDAGVSLHVAFFGNRSIPYAHEIPPARQPPPSPYSGASQRTPSIPQNSELQDSYSTPTTPLHTPTGGSSRTRPRAPRGHTASGSGLSSATASASIFSPRHTPRNFTNPPQHSSPLAGEPVGSGGSPQHQHVANAGTTPRAAYNSLSEPSPRFGTAPLDVPTAGMVHTPVAYGHAAEEQAWARQAVDRVHSQSQSRSQAQSQFQAQSQALPQSQLQPQPQSQAQTQTQATLPRRSPQAQPESQSQSQSQSQPQYQHQQLSEQDEPSGSSSGPGPGVRRQSTQVARSSAAHGRRSGPYTRPIQPRGTPPPSFTSQTLPSQRAAGTAQWGSSSDLPLEPSPPLASSSTSDYVPRDMARPPAQPAQYSQPVPTSQRPGWGGEYQYAQSSVRGGGGGGRGGRQQYQQQFPPSTASVANVMAKDRDPPPIRPGQTMADIWIDPSKVRPTEPVLSGVHLKTAAMAEAYLRAEGQAREQAQSQSQSSTSRPQPQAQARGSRTTVPYQPFVMAPRIPTPDGPFTTPIYRARQAQAQAQAQSLSQPQSQPQPPPPPQSQQNNDNLSIQYPYQYPYSRS